MSNRKVLSSLTFFMLFSSGIVVAAECPPNGVQDNCTGTWAFDSEISYSGEFKDGLPHGKGTLTWDNGDQYIGEFIYSKITGKGSYEWTNGDNYFGYLNKDNKTGEGILTISKQ